MSGPPARPLRVLHLVGSPTDDFFADLSRLYAADCLAATADPGRYDVRIAYVTPDRRWRFPAGLAPEEIAAAPSLAVADAVAHLAGLSVDVTLPQLFCREGMTSYRALLDVLQIPYVGNRAEVMALGADKARTRAVVAAAGVDVPPGRVLRRGETSDLDGLALPVVVKPVAADNSVGLSLVRRPEELGAALAESFSHADEVLVETYVPLGREVRCGIVVRDGELVGLPLEEYAVDSVTKPVRDRGDKLRRTDRGDLALVAKDAEHAWIVDPDPDGPDGPLTERVWAVARAAHVALGCRHYSLFDFRIDPEGRPWFLEAGLYCSFADQSVVAVMAAADGIPTPELLELCIREALP